MNVTYVLFQRAKIKKIFGASFAYELLNVSKVLHMPAVTSLQIGIKFERIDFILMGFSLFSQVVQPQKKRKRKQKEEHLHINVLANRFAVSFVLDFHLTYE